MAEWIGKTIRNVRIEKLLARGGMAEVYLGSHLNLERPVAVKLLHSFIEEEPLLLERFHREAKVVAGLRHPNIVQIFDFDTVDGHPYIVMEYLKGPTLATYLRHLHQRKRRIAPDQVGRLLNELSVALDYAHRQGVIHRDIKPGNIILHNRTEEVVLDKPLTSDVEAVITDFGLVRIVNAATQTVSGTVSGTPAYMSPEQARGDQTDHRTDIYSLGIVLYEMLAGRVPFEADSTLTILHMQIHTIPPPIPGISPKVQGVIDRALQKNAEDRYPTSRELAMDYSRAIGIGTEAATIPEPSRPSSVPIEVVAPPARETAPKAEPERKPEPPPKVEPPVKEELATKPEPVVRPARSRSGITFILLSVIGLAVLAVAGYFIFSRLGQSNPPVPIPTSSPEISNTPTSPLPSETSSPPITEGMVPIPADTYQVGKAQGDKFSAASQSVTLPEFLIDKFPVTNQKFQQFMAGWQFPTGQETFPAMKVTWEQADSYCKSLNKRLPSEAEWEAAARGPGANPPLYPWGSTPSPPGGGRLPNHEYAVGSLDFNQSPLGVYDMIGNVYEWVAEPYLADVEPGKKLLRGVRAGNTPDITFRAQVAPQDTNYTDFAGFRCAADQVS